MATDLDTRPDEGNDNIQQHYDSVLGSLNSAESQAQSGATDDIGEGPERGLYRHEGDKPQPKEQADKPGMAAGVAAGLAPSLVADSAALAAGPSGIAGTLLRRFSGAKLNGKRTITGLVITAVLAAGGFFGIMSTLGGFEVIHAGELLGHFSAKNNSDSSSSVSTLVQDAKAIKKANVGYSKVSILGDKIIVSKVIPQLEESGITINTNKYLNSPTDVTYEKAKLAERYPEVKSMTNEEYSKFLSEKTNVPASQFKVTDSRTGNLKVDISRFKFKDIGSLVSSNLRIAGNGKVTTAIQMRTLRKFYGLGSLFHPFDRLVGEKIRNAIDAKVKAGESKSQATKEAYDDAAKAEKTSLTSPVEARADTAQKTIEDKKNGVSGKIAGAALGAAALACVVRQTSNEIVEVNQDRINAPAQIAAIDLTAKGAALKYGDDKNLTPEQMKLAEKEANMVLSSPGGRALAGGNSTANAPKSDLPAGYRTAFADSTSAQGIRDATSKAFGTSQLADTICSPEFLIGATTILIIKEVAAAVTAPESGGGSLALATGTTVLADKVFALGVTAALTGVVTNFIVDKNTQGKLAEDVFQTPLGGSLIVHGARAVNNTVAYTSGGIGLDNEQSTLATSDQLLQDRQNFQSKSTFAKIFDTSDYRTVTGHMADSLATATPPSILGSFLHIGSMLSSTFGSLIPRASAANTASYSGGFNWEFAQAGIPDFIRNSSIYQHPYATADAVATRLNQECADPSTGEVKSCPIIDQVSACFGDKIDKTGSDKAWDVIPDHAVNSHSQEYTDNNCNPFVHGSISDDEAWAQMIVFINSTINMKAFACYEGDGESCQDLGQTAGDANPAAATPPTTGGGASFGVGTLNSLGASHTCPSGGGCQHPGWPDYKVRAQHEVQAVVSSGVAMIGFQELQTDQQKLFKQFLGTGWSTWNQGSVANTIAWRNDVFDATPIDKGSFSYPYYNGGTQHASWAVLKVTATGQQVVLTNFHPESLLYPGHTQAAHDQDILNMANLWKATLAQKYPGVPIVLTGDMNGSYIDFFCPFGKNVTQGALSADGSKVVSGKCTKGSAPSSIDWIIASGDSGAVFTNYKRDTSLENNHWTDHPYVTATVTFPGSTGSTSTNTGQATPATISGVKNFRDAAASNAALKPRTLYRSAQLDKLTAAGSAQLSQLLGTNGTIIDLRTLKQRQNNPDVAVGNTRTINVPIEGILDQSPMVTDATRRSQLGKALKAAENAPGSVLVHCTDGKDRTGWMVAMIMYNAGASNSQVMTEYMESSNTYPAGVKEAWLNSGLDAIKSNYGSVKAYLKNGVGLNDSDLQKLKQKFGA